MTDQLHIAIDLGAGSGRVFLGWFGEDQFLLEEVRRFHYPPRRAGNHLRWDFGLILSEIEAGLTAASERAAELGRPVYSIGVDSWGVDFGLIDANGDLIEDPVCYRDERTAKVMDRFFSIISRDELYRRTGIQILNFNTVFQIFSHLEEGLPQAAASLLLMPDLVNFHLTGVRATEYTNATTTQLIDPVTKSWERAIIENLGLPERLFTRIVEPGTEIGRLHSVLSERTGLKDVRVIAPATHDTGSAFAGAPLRAGWACISSGTWSLVGVELNGPVIDDQTARNNFTNEGGAFGTIRFLKNVMGLWILESCRREWSEGGNDVDYDQLLKMVEQLGGEREFIYPDDEGLFNPVSMIEAINEQLTLTGRERLTDPAGLTRVILDSLAFRYASVIGSIEKLTGKLIEGIQIVGGGSRNRYLNQMTANATGKPVLAGPVESTVIGNLVVQAIMAGRFEGPVDARGYIADRLELLRYEPEKFDGREGALRRYERIEAAH